MTISPRPEILTLAEAAHGTADEAELERLGIDSKGIVDFSTNVNPFGPSPNVGAVLARTEIHRYPDRECRSLRREIGKRLGMPEEQLLAGNGAGELLTLLAQAFLQPRDDVLVIGPTYAEYARSALIMGARCAQWNSLPASEGDESAVQIKGELHRLIPRAVYLCNPNNPTGRFFQPAIIDALAREFDQTLFVVDEAFIDFVPNAPSSICFHRTNVVVLRSLTKAFGLPGLRLGYLVGNPEVVRTLARVRMPWSVNAAAQISGIAALQDEEHLRRSIAKISEYKQSFVADLKSVGMNALPSTTPFFLVGVGDSGLLRLKLLQSSILVRDCSSFGLPGFIRIATRFPDDNRKLVDAVAALSGTKGLLEPASSNNRIAAPQ